MLRSRTTRMSVCCAAVCLALLGACTADDGWRVAEGKAQRAHEGPFYEVPDPLPAGRPGQLIRSERILGAPEGALGWSILYHSRDVNGADIAVSGVVLAPAAGAERDRPVVSWGHPTTGAAVPCAPSLGIDPFDMIEGAVALVDDGYVVVATDYPGMGAKGPWSYLIGETEGHAVLDAARAAAQIPETRAGRELLLWGHSQGGHAALFAAEAAEEYAPELDLAAVAVAAPAVELAELLDDDIGDSAGVALGSYAFWAYDQVYGDSEPDLTLDQILSTAGVAATPRMAELCLLGQHAALHRIADPLVGEYLTTNPAKVEPWATLLEQNTPAAERLDAPLLVAQGLADDLVHPETTEGFVADMCRAGQPVEFHRYRRITHLLVAERALPAVQQFFADALDGEPTLNTCPSR